MNRLGPHLPSCLMVGVIGVAMAANFTQAPLTNAVFYLTSSAVNQMGLFAGRRLAKRTEPVQEQQVEQKSHKAGVPGGVG